ncbi:TPA: aspartate carbamoyltransferase [Candidatus Poribacteria bacterium]|nr:aspartate carbamoyltransferase [Candidatus Poribacteria bacterium]HEX30208.1 aspartate carbamoyltransferase [Candidatus Poribacteria bacterium]
MSDFIFIDRFKREEIEGLFELTDDIKSRPDLFASKCRGKILATLFYEPSTRTRLSFESAMLRLGGSVLGFADAKVSSAAKGETIADTARMVSNYADLIVIRHPLAGAAQVMADYSEVPVINGGDDSNQHPTQTLLDLYTISRCKGRIEGLNVGICGDLRYGRAPHSLALGLAMFGGKIINIAPQGLEMPRHVIERLRILYGADVETVRDLKGVISDLDVLYVNRLQKERLPEDMDYEEIKDSYAITPNSIRSSKPDMIIMHPLPRVNELSYELDGDSRAIYFEQSRNGLFIRMALILALTGKAHLELNPVERERIELEVKCGNPRCVTDHEPYLHPTYEILSSEGEEKFCVYCGYRL